MRVVPSLYNGDGNLMRVFMNFGSTEHVPHLAQRLLPCFDCTLSSFFNVPLRILVFLSYLNILFLLHFIFLFCNCRCNQIAAHGSPPCHAATASLPPARLARVKWQPGYRTRKKWIGVQKVRSCAVRRGWDSSQRIVTKFSFLNISKY